MLASVQMPCSPPSPAWSLCCVTRRQQGHAVLRNLHLTDSYVEASVQHRHRQDNTVISTANQHFFIRATKTAQPHGALKTHVRGGREVQSMESFHSCNPERSALAWLTVSAQYPCRPRSDHFFLYCYFNLGHNPHLEINIKPSQSQSVLFSV